MQKDTVLYVENLSGGYRTSYGYFRAVDRASLKLYLREIVGIVGESGSGKTTLLKLILSKGCIPSLVLEQGKVVIGNIDANYISCEEWRRQILGRELAYVPQSAYDAIYPYKKIWNFYKDMLRDHGIDINTKEAENRIKQDLSKYIESVGLDTSILDRYPFELSGGMRQRAVIAIASSLRPSVLLLDEPTSALDVVTQRRVLSMIAEIFEKGYIKSALMSSHDVASLRQLAHRIYVMYSGRIFEYANTDTVIKSPMHPYTQMLIEALEAFEGFKSHREFKPKVVYKSLTTIYDMWTLKGCRFHLRCPYAMDVCRSEEPPMVEIDREHHVMCWLYVKR